MLPRPQKVEFKDGRLNPGAGHQETSAAFSPKLFKAVIRHNLDVYDLSFDVQDSCGEHPSIDSDYSYSIRVDPKGILVSAASEWGALSACSTLNQLSCEGFIPYCDIADQPEYPWRGLMIDVSRHFMSIDVLKRNLDLMEYFRMNVLHLHLSDDQAFRFPCVSFPKLPSEQHYSLTELGELIEYAADRAIRVVPEIDVLGHTHSWLVGYPEWGIERVEGPSSQFGVHTSCLDPSNPIVVDAVKQVFSEVVECFPDEYVHFGGDEVNPASWLGDEKFVKWMDSQGFRGAKQVEAAFNEELAQTLVGWGKRPIGWDEVLDESLDRNTTVQFWRGMAEIDRVRLCGFDVVVSSPYYLDLHYPAHIHHLYYPDMPRNELSLAHTATLEDARLDHVRDGVALHLNFGEVGDLERQTDGRILGGEACMWSELVNEKLVLQRIWSRLPAIASRLWNGGRDADVDTVYSEAAKCYRHLENMGYTNLCKVGLTAVDAPLEPLLEMLEPVKWYGRHLGSERMKLRSEGGDEGGLPRPYDTNTPLNRWIDFIPPESLAMREFVIAYESGEDVSRWVNSWKRQAEFCDSVGETDARIIELLPASHALSKLGDIVKGSTKLELDLGGPFGDYVLPVADEVKRIQLDRVLACWDLKGDVTEVKRGHINDTFRACDQWMLQRINSTVFIEPQNLLTNFRLLEPAIQDLVPSLVRTSSEDDFVVTPDGCVWRVYEYIESRNFDVLPDDLCELAGDAFGKFLSRLGSTSVELTPNIEDFHQLDKYLATLDNVRVAGDADEELEFVDSRRGSAADFSDERQIIHGDCKVNNLLFHPTKDEVVAIVDLDTLMWGHPAWDYGDLVRSVVTGRDIHEQVTMRIAAVTRGFTEQFVVAPNQRHKFARAPAHMSFMLGVRFLADHFAGDEYFKVAYHGENLTRAKEQFALTVLFEDLEEEIARVLR